MGSGGVRRRWLEGDVSDVRVGRSEDIDRVVDRGISEIEKVYRRRNRIPISLSKVVMMAGELAGYRYGRNGLLSYLTYVAEKDYKVFCGLLSKAMGVSDRFRMEEGNCTGYTITVSGLGEDSDGVSGDVDGGVIGGDIISIGGGVSDVSDIVECGGIEGEVVEFEEGN